MSQNMFVRSGTMAAQTSGPQIVAAQMDRRAHINRQRDMISRRLNVLRSKLHECEKTISSFSDTLRLTDVGSAPYSQHDVLVAAREYVDPDGAMPLRNAARSATRNVTVMEAHEDGSLADYVSCRACYRAR